MWKKELEEEALTPVCCVHIVIDDVRTGVGRQKQHVLRVIYRRRCAMVFNKCVARTFAAIILFVACELLRQNTETNMRQFGSRLDFMYDYVEARIFTSYVSASYVGPN